MLEDFETYDTAGRAHAQAKKRVKTEQTCGDCAHRLPFTGFCPHECASVKTTDHACKHLKPLTKLLP